MATAIGIGLQQFQSWQDVLDKAARTGTVNPSVAQDGTVYATDPSSGFTVALGKFDAAALGSVLGAAHGAAVGFPTLGSAAGNPADFLSSLTANDVQGGVTPLSFASPGNPDLLQLISDELSRLWNALVSALSGLLAQLANLFPSIPWTWLLIAAALLFVLLFARRR